MLERLKYCDGNVSLIPEIPDDLKLKYVEAFDVDPICDRSLPEVPLTNTL